MQRKPWTKEELIEEATKYNSIAELQRANKAAYNAAWNMGVVDEIRGLLKNCLTMWTQETIHKEALKYADRFDFQTRSYAAYGAAQRRKILDIVCGHMKKVRHVSGHEKELLSIIKSFYPNAAKKKWTRIFIEGKPHIKGFEIDIFIPGINRGVEFDGTYYHSMSNLKRSRPHWPEEDLKNYHKIKDDFFLSKGIHILHIQESDWLMNKEACVHLCLDFYSNSEAPAASS